MHRIKLLFLWAVPCPDWLKARASRTFWKTLSQPLMRHSTSPPSHSEGLQRIPRDLRWLKVMRNSLRGRSRPWLMMNDRSPGPLEPRAVATPFPDWHSGPDSTQLGSQGSLFGPWRTLAGTLDPPFGPWLRDLPLRCPGPDASLRCVYLVSLWGPTFSLVTQPQNLQLVVHLGYFYLCASWWVGELLRSDWALCFKIVILCHAGFERPDAESWRRHLCWRTQGPQKWRVC